MRRRLEISLVLLTLVILDAAASPFLPLYVVDSPEVPTREGQLFFFYVDRGENYYIENGSQRFGYDARWLFSTTYGYEDAVPTFAGTLIMNVIVAVFSAVMIAVLVARERPRLRRWMLFAFLIVGWLASWYFVTSFTNLQQHWMNGHFSGFFSSVHAEWTDAWTYYGPGFGWWLMLANSLIITAVFVLLTPWKSIESPKKNVEGKVSEPEG